MMKRAIQDFYPEKYSHCYGCGTLNEQGLKIKTYLDGDETVCTFVPDEHFHAFPGIVYGGLIASIIDCHSIGSAAAFAYRNEGREPGSKPPIRFLTASLKVDYLKPTPMGAPLELRSKALEIKPKKVIVETELSVDGVVCAKGHVVAVKLPDEMLKED